MRILGIKCSPMTVIVYAFIPDSGFMLAADGRRRDGITKEIVSDCAQKIYSATHADCALAFAWCSSTVLGTPLGSFDFAKQTIAFLRDKAEIRYDSWCEFVGGLVTGLYGSLILCARGTQIYPIGSQNEQVIAGVILLGYFHGHACQAVVKFWHENGTLRKPLIQELRVLEDKPYFDERRPEIGSLTAESFFKEKVTACPDTLPDAIKTAEMYIKACAEKSPDYGGRTHIATQTKEGFEWKISPLKC